MKNSIHISPIKRGSIFLEAGFLDWYIPEDKIVLCQYLSKKLPFETTDIIQSYSAWTKLIKNIKVVFLRSLRVLTASMLMKDQAWGFLSAKREAHGGTITVQSNPTGGCDFIIKILK